MYNHQTDLDDVLSLDYLFCTTNHHLALSKVKHAHHLNQLLNDGYQSSKLFHKKISVLKNVYF